MFSEASVWSWDRFFRAICIFSSAVTAFGSSVARLEMALGRGRWETSAAGITQLMASFHSKSFAS
eukprot:8162566-Heterocapsa_arctica.AAC.1